MLHYSSDINFLIWGVRNGFEVMLASSPTDIDHLKVDVVNDNMRQICNVSPKRFFSIYRTTRFAAVSIYHTDAKDIFSRNAYIAITLYVPLSRQLDGNVGGTLTNLMDFYLLKQEGASVNMFTEEMVRDRYKELTSKSCDGSLSFGSKCGYQFFENESDISERLERLNIDGYKVVFFFPPSNHKATEQLDGFESVNTFRHTNRIVLESYDPQLYDILQNNKLIVQGPGSIIIDGLPGELIIVTHKSSGKNKKLYFQSSLQTFIANQLFPISQKESFPPPHTPKNKNKAREMAAKAIIIVAVIALGIFGYYYSLLTSVPGEQAGGGLKKMNKQIWKSSQELFLKSQLSSEDSLKIIKEVNGISGVNEIKITSNRDSIFISFEPEKEDTILQQVKKISIMLDSQSKKSNFKPPNRIAAPKKPITPNTKISSPNNPATREGL